MRRPRANRYAILCTLILIVSSSYAAYPKDAPEAVLIREGRLYEAAVLLQKLTKDAAAQRRSAELYLRLALYDRAIERLVVTGKGRQEAAVLVISEAFSQGNRAAALGLAIAEGLSAQAEAEFARRELAEGRARAALGLARESGDAALIAAAGVAAYEETVAAPPVIVDFLSGAPRRMVYSPDGRFIVLQGESGSDIEIQDTRQRAALSASARSRIASPGFPVDEIAMDRAGRFLALVGRARGESGKESTVLSVERLDNGLVVRRLELPGRYPKAKTSALAFAGDLLCAAAGKRVLLIDPWGGEVKASASAAEGIASIEYVAERGILVCSYPGSGKVLVLNAKNLQVSKEPYSAGMTSRDRLSLIGAGRPYSEARGLSVYVPSSSIEDLRVESAPGGPLVTSGPLSRPLAGGAELRYSGGIDAVISPDGLILAILAREGIVLAPFPFLDRAESAAVLAREFGQTDRFAPLCGYLIDQGRLDEAKRLWSLAGVEEATISLMLAEAKLRRGEKLEAASDFIAAGQAGRALQIADALVEAAASGPELEAAFEDGAAIYGKAKEPTARLADAAGRKAESIAAHAAAVEYYAMAGSREAVERLAFDPSLATVEWCLFAGGKLGLPEADIYSRAAAILEGRKKWGEAATAFLWLRDDKGLSRVVKAALSGADWDYKVLDALKKRADPAMCRAAAESLLSKGELVYAAEQYAAIADLTGVSRVADRAIDSDDFIFALELYSVLGTSSSRAATAARLKLVYDEIGAAIKDAEAYLSQETVDGVNAGRIPIQWPVPASKAEEPSYMQAKLFGEALLAIPSAPRSAEAKRCASYLSKEAVKIARAAPSGRAEELMGRAARFTFAGRLLSAMGR